MLVKKIKPITPGTRFRLAPNFSLLTTNKPEKSLLISSKKTGGRNNTGKMTIRQKGGGHKKHRRIIDFKRNKYDILGTVKTIEYDPMRNAYISLIHYQDGQKAYILYPKGLKVGSKIIAGKKVEPETGNAMPLNAMPIGTVVHNIALAPDKHGAIARSAGTHAQLMAKEGKYVTLQLPSGEVRKILSACIATVGTVGNGDHINIRLGKAGRNRWLDNRPRVRGVAMNPVDHSMGGREGGGSKQEKSRQGIFTKGKRTRNPKKTSTKLILKRRK